MGGAEAAVVPVTHPLQRVFRKDYGAHAATDWAAVGSVATVQSVRAPTPGRVQTTPLPSQSVLVCRSVGVSCWRTRPQVDCVV